MFDRIKDALWWDAALRVNTGCTKVSSGCDNCWAESEMKMRSKSPNLAIRDQWAGDFKGDVRLLGDNIEKVLKARVPKAWALWNDLFHPEVPFEYIDQVHAAFATKPNQLGIVLTKRPERAAEYGKRILDETWDVYTVSDHFGDVFLDSKYYISKAEGLEERDKRDWVEDETGPTPRYDKFYDEVTKQIEAITWPFKNIWLGTSAEDQKRLDERVESLFQCRAELLFLSLEPCLGPMDVRACLEPVQCVACSFIGTRDDFDVLGADDGKLFCNQCGSEMSARLPDGVGWVIVGAESRGGAASRECKIEWVRDIVNQCKEANVPVFVKQLHVDGKLVKDMKKFPEDLQLRQVPVFDCGKV